MEQPKASRLFRRAALAAGALLFLCAPAGAQVIINAAVAQPTLNNSDHWQISVQLGASFDVPTTSISAYEDPSKNPAKNPASYRLIDVDNGQRIDIVHIDLPPFSSVSAGNLPFALVLYLDPSVRLKETKHYHLYVLGLTFNGNPSDPPPQAAVQFPEAGMIAVASAPTPGTVTTAPMPAGAAQEEARDETASGDSLSFTAAEGREDANVYLSGEVAGASGEDFEGSVDIKLEYPHRRIIGRRTHSFNPFFDLKASTADDADPDSMSFGLNWEFPAWRYRGDNLHAPIRRIIWRNAPKIEAERDFDNANFIWESRFRFMSRTYTGPRATLYFRPFVGHELGANLKSPVEEADGRFIYRLMTGTTLNLIFPLQAADLEDISFEASYIRRWPLRREVSFEEDDNGDLQPLPIGTSPRDHVNLKLNFNFTKSFGSTISYEYGELPPSFKLVDHKTSIGLTYKIKVDR